MSGRTRPYIDENYTEMMQRLRESLPPEESREQQIQRWRQSSDPSLRLLNFFGENINIGDSVNYLRYTTAKGLELSGPINASAATITGTIIAADGNIGGFYIGADDLWGGNKAIENVATTIVLGNLDGTSKIALGATADDITIAGTQSGFIADGGGNLRVGDANSFLKWSGGALAIQLASGEALTIKSGGDISVEGGGDIILTGHDDEGITNKGTIQFESGKMTMGGRISTPGFGMWDDSESNDLHFYLGAEPIEEGGPPGAVLKPFYFVSINSGIVDAATPATSNFTYYHESDSDGRGHTPSTSYGELEVVGAQDKSYARIDAMQLSTNRAYVEAFAADDNGDDDAYISLYVLEDSVGGEIARINYDGVFFNHLNDNIVDILGNRQMTGFQAWTSGSSGTTWTITGGGAFQLDRDGYGYIDGKRIDWLATLTTSALNADLISYIYIDTAGAIQVAETRTDALFTDNIVLFEVHYDGTNYHVVKENHAYGPNAVTSNYMHHLAGTVLTGSGAIISRTASGTGAAADDRRLDITANAEVEDHGLQTTVSALSGAALVLNHYYTDGTGDWKRDSMDSEFPMEYNNSGTPTAIDNNKFGVFRIYISKDNIEVSTPTYYSVMHSAQFPNHSQADDAISEGVAEATGPLADLELAQLGYIIVKNTGAGGYILEVFVAKSKLTSSIIGAEGSNTAGLVTLDVTNFDGVLSASDSNVQAAMETLDDIVILDAANGSDNRVATFTDANSLNGEAQLIFNGTELGIGVDPNAPFHVKRGGANIDSTADVLGFFQFSTTNDNVAIALLSGNSGVSTLYFGDEADWNEAYLRYTPASNAFSFIGGNVLIPAAYSNDMNGDTMRDLQVNNSGELGWDSSTKLTKINEVKLDSISWLYDLIPYEYERRKKKESKGKITYLDEGLGVKEIGIFAEEMAVIRPELVYFDDDKSVGINYKGLIVPILTEVQKHEREIIKLKNEIQSLKAV